MLLAWSHPARSVFDTFLLLYPIIISDGNWWSFAVRLVFIRCPVICPIFVFLSQLLWIRSSCLLWFRINWKSFKLWLDTLNGGLVCFEAVYMFRATQHSRKELGCRLHLEWVTNSPSLWLSGPRPYVAATARLHNSLFICIIIVLLLIIFTNYIGLFIFRKDTFFAVTFCLHSEHREVWLPGEK